jgi:hypothetical protein
MVAGCSRDSPWRRLTLRRRYHDMTDQFTALTPSAMRQIIENLDDSLLVLERYKGRMTASQLQLKSMLGAIRRQLAEELHRLEQQNDLSR